MRGRERKFKYKKRTPEQMSKRASMGDGSRDGYVKSDFPLFRPAAGLNKIRILGPTWDNPDHWGYDVWVHYGIGPDNNTYLCLEKMQGEECPICVERLESIAEDEQYAKSLKPNRRVLIWLIDRKNEDQGPILWASPQTFDGSVFKMSVESGDGVLFIDDPEEGYDVEFEYIAPANKKPGKYDAIRIARRSTAISNEDWLVFAEENPVPTTLLFHSADRISKQFGGKVSSYSEPAKKREEPETKSRTGSSKELTWELVNDMGPDALEKEVEELGLGSSVSDSTTDQELMDMICEKLKLSPPKVEKEEKVEENKVTRQGSYRDKLDKLRSRQ